MRWYKLESPNFPYIPGDLCTDATIWFNDDNKKPEWIEFPPKFTEIHVRRNKKTLLIIVGESWTYGENLPGIGTAIKQYNLDSQLSHGIGSRMAVMLDADLYQYAVPGNCNMYMFSELERMLAYVSTLDYEKVYISIQMTEPGREKGVINDVQGIGHPLRDLYNSDKQYEMKDWLLSYDQIFFDIYQKTLEKFDLNIDAILWKNFCRIVTPRRDYKFKIIETSWIQYSGNILNKKLEMPSFYSVGWFADLQETYKIEIDIEWANKQLDMITKSNEFIKNNPLHNNHPNAQGHLLWAQYLCRLAGWRDDI